MERIHASDPPGTVSKILWHFTGGPKWNELRNCQQSRPKPPVEAYHALLSILETRQLRLGQYRELVKVQVPKLRRYNSKTGRKELTDTVVERTSYPVCCLADIPLAHLSYQAKRYGKIAIGFHREAPVRHGFNPVFYTLRDSTVLQSLHEGFEYLDEIGEQSIWSIARDAVSEIEELECKQGHVVEMDTGLRLGLKSDIEEIGDVVAKAHKRLKHFLAFVKTFQRQEFSTIYCEREWRSIQPFSFKIDDVAMVVLPKRSSGTSFFESFIADEVSRLELPRSIPVVSWEDLIEH